jgi:NAD(P)-dependent dehydrogenase (short-subunit alcohol dehydrogenase family)
MDFEGKVAVITGGGGGIGFGLAEIAARRGMKVALADVEAPVLATAEQRLRDAGATTLAVQTDVSSAASVDALAERVFDEWGAVDLLCNNAGVNVIVTRPIWELSRGDWEWVIGVNQWGLINGIQSFLPRMLEQGTEGHILNTSSAAGVIAGPGLAAYKASKHASLAISETLFHDLRTAGSPIGVSVFCPDVVKTGLRQAARNRPEHLRDDAAKTPEEAAAEERLQASPGLSPNEAAELAWKGMESGQLYIFTGTWTLGAARERMEDMESGVPRTVTLRDVED